MRSIRQLKNLKGKIVLLRADFNAPIKNGKIVDDSRIREVFPTIRFLLARGGRVVVLSHHSDPRQRLKPVQKHLARFFSPKKVVLLENLRFQKGEEKNDPVFARRL